MERILLGHGSGGRLMHQLIREHFAPEFGIDILGDSAVLDLGLNVGGDLSGGGPRLAFTTDSYVVSPVFFPGGDIGCLAIFGTVNDLSVAGARPLFLSVGFIIEEGFPLDDLSRILSSMAAAAKDAGVRVVTGDTKVVEQGKGDGIFINTCGIGIVPGGVSLGPEFICPGDKVIVSGPVGNHGVAVLAERNGLSFAPPIVSDTAPLNSLVEAMLSVGGVKMMRDPTRGGLATTLKELALEAGLGFLIDEEAITVSGGVRGACDLLGIDPLYVANEGILVAIVAASAAEAIVEKMRCHPRAGASAVIGEVMAEDRSRNGMVLLKTPVGGTRIIDMLSGEQLPRIC
ncbi:MAG: hydrogenase expression/formation protein HypE [Chloroflexota bacterium]